jgi:DNA-binding transcriptional ArsR family regulator
LALLARQGLTVSGVAGHFSISRPAVSRHLRILAESGLVVVRRQGRQRYCEARLERLDEVSHWVERYRKIWEKRLDRLDEYLIELQEKEEKHGKE